jgi:Phosphotransferase enzyme family
MTISDEKLPHMGELMNTAGMREIFERELIPAGEISDFRRIDDCQILSVKYRPGKSCLVTYLLTIKFRKKSRSHTQMMTALTCGEGESLPLFLSAQQELLVPDKIGCSLLHLPALESVVWVFPNDRKLTGLPALTNLALLKKSILPDLLKKVFSGEWRMLERGVVHYMAERSCMISVNLELQGAGAETTRSIRLFGKTYCLDEGEAAWNGHKHIWESDARRRGRLVIPQPLAYQPEIKTVWQIGLDGMTLNEFDDQTGLFTELLEKAGSAVANLHRIQTPFAPLITVKEINTKLEASTELLTRAIPARRADLEDTVDRLTVASGLVERCPMTTLHGDLHLKNFYVTKGQIALIDLDDLCQGDPLKDVGSCVAALYYRGLLRGRSYSETEKIAAQFIEAYRAEAGWELSEPALNWHTAAALIYERAYRSVTRMKAGGLAILGEIIELARVISARM